MISMHEIVGFLHELVAFVFGGIREGYQHINGPLGLVVALFFAYSMNDLKRIWVTGIAATLTYLVLQVVLPVLDERGTARLPPDLISANYLRTAIALYLGFLVVISIFVFLKKQFLGSGKPAAKAH
jgi:hypothetical protein